MKEFDTIKKVRAEQFKSYGVGSAIIDGGVYYIHADDTIRINCNDKMTIMKRGDWFVRYPNGHEAILSDKEFALHFIIS